MEPGSNENKKGGIEDSEKAFRDRRIHSGDRGSSRTINREMETLEIVGMSGRSSLQYETKNTKKGYKAN